jgi:hypothetical protein
MLEAEKPFRLHIGCHSGTMTSRDSSNEYHNTLDEAKEAIRQSVESYSRLGAYLWFATVFDANGKKIHHVNGVPYL